MFFFGYAEVVQKSSKREPLPSYFPSNILAQESNPQCLLDPLGLKVLALFAAKTTVFCTSTLLTTLVTTGRPSAFGFTSTDRSIVDGQVG